MTVTNPLNFSRFMLLTGKPRTGKSTLFNRLVREIRDDVRVFYVLSREIREKDCRIGFEVVTSQLASPITFAKKDPQGLYQLDVNVWNRVAEQLQQNKEKILLLDEIGSMQLRSPAFQDVVMDLLNSHARVFATIALQGDQEGFIDALKSHTASTVYELTEENGDELFDVFSRELHACRTGRGREP